jgi:hypothetical protein
MKEPAFAGPAQADNRNAQDSAAPLVPQGLADFISSCTDLGWHVEMISRRLLKLTDANGSVLLAGADPRTYADTIRRIGDANDFARRHRRP